MRNLIASCITIFVIGLVTIQAHALRSDAEMTSPKLSRAQNNFARWEIRTAPVALIARWVTVDVSYRLSEKFSIGPAAIIYSASAEERGSFLTPAYEGLAAGLNGMYYFDSLVKNTWYASFHGYYEDFESYPHATREQEFNEVSGFKGNLALGYQWRWRLMSVLAGVGLEYRNHQESEVRLDFFTNKIERTDVSGSAVLPFIEFKVGLEI